MMPRDPLKKRPAHALHVFATLNRGGAEAWLMDVVRNTSREELALDVCVVQEGTGAYEEEFQSLGGRVHRCRIGRTPWGFATRFECLLAGTDYDVVHSHLYYFSGIVLRSAARAGVPKRIAHNHPAEDIKALTLRRRVSTWWMRRLMCRYGTSFVGPTRASLEGFWGPDWQNDPNRRVLYNGIQVDRFVRPVDRSALRTELGIPADAPIVLNVARFAPHKRQTFLVDVAAEVLAQRHDVYFLLIGAGALKASVEQRVRDKGIDDHFRFISGLPNIDQHWLSADVFAFPSENEGFGIVIAEAAAAGLAVVAQDIPGVREAATACPDCVLLPKDSSEEQWAQVLLAKLEKGRMIESKRQDLLRSFPFTISASIESLKDLYALDSPRDTPSPDEPPGEAGSPGGCSARSFEQETTR